MDNSIARGWLSPAMVLLTVAVALLLGIGASVDVGGAEGTNPVGTQLVLRATGSAGDEIMVVEVGGRVGRSYRLHRSEEIWSAPEYRNYYYTHPTSFSLADVRVLFRNDGVSANGEDRNIRVDWFRLGGTEVQAESSTVRSAGAWTDGTCSPLQSNADEVLACGGYFSFLADHGGGSTIPPSDENVPPVVNAGRDQRVTADASGTASVRLSATASDPDGSIQRVRWLEGQQEIASGLTATVSLTVGSHQLSARVTDDEGATSDDTVLIVVEPADAGGQGSTIELFAAGLEGSEEIFLEIDGSSVQRYGLPQSPNFWSGEVRWTRYTYQHNASVRPGQVRVLFNNDLYVEGQIDRNVKLQRVVIDGVSYPTTDPAVVSLGSAQGDSCEVAGRFQTDLLNCRGFFQFAGGTTSGSEGPRLEVAEVVTGIDTPWDLGFLPDGSMLFTERPGRLSIRRTNGQVSQVQADLSDVVEEGNAGLMSLVVDPSFSSNRRFYTCQSQQTDRFTIVVVAWQLSADGGSAARIGEPLARVRQDPGHGGCRTRFDGEGYLVVGSGDGYEGPAPQDLTRLAGKTYRIDRFTGDAAPGNPFLNSPNSQTRKIWTYGHRNVQGLALRPGTGDMWSVEHGPAVDDEVNQLVGGGNYGWDPVVIPGFEPEFPNYEQDRNPMTDFSKFPDAQAARWSSGNPTVAPSGAVFLQGSQWGSYEGALAVLTLKDSRLRLMFFDDDGNFVRQVIPDELAGTYGRMRSPVLGPDGNLYVTTSNSGLGDARNDVILRVTPRQ